MISQIASTIHQQVGRQALGMMGAKNLIAGDNWFSFRIGRVAKGFANYVKITLNASDLYDVEFKKLHGMGVTDIADVPMVHIENLHAVIEKHTGMYTSL